MKMPLNEKNDGSLHWKGVKIPKDKLGAPTWLPFRSIGTSKWLL